MECNSIARKVCLLGDFSVGKSSTVARYVRNTFSDAYLTTVGVRVDTKRIEMDATQVLRLVIWDIAGSSKLDQLRLNYVSGSHGFVLVADGTRRDTLASALELWQQAGTVLQQKVPAILLLNKFDLADEWEISPEAVESLRSHLPVFCVSAKTGEGVEAAIESLGRSLA